MEGPQPGCSGLVLGGRSSHGVQAIFPGEWLGKRGVDAPIMSPATERLSCASSLEFPLHWQFRLSVLVLRQGAALWLLHGRIHCLRHLTAPPPTPVEQEAAHGQQDQDDAAG